MDARRLLQRRSGGVPKPRKTRRRNHDLCDALRSLCSIGGDLMVNAFGHPLPPFPRHAPSTLLRALQRLHTHQFSARLLDTADAVASSAESVCSPRDAADISRVYLPYVAASYDGAAGGCCPESVGDSPVIFGDYDGLALWSPCFYVARDDELKRFVVAVRGTKSFNDVVTDILADTVPFGNVDGGVAHRGFLKASVGILEKIRPLLRSQLAACPGYSVTICGHSLGAACSALMLKLMQDEGGFGDDLLAVAIACPPCFAPLKAVDARWAAALYSYVHADDIMPRVSLVTVRNLILHFSHLDRLKLTSGKVKDMSVAELDCRLPDHGKPVFGVDCVVMPGYASDCPDPNCQELAASRRRSGAYADAYGSYPVGDGYVRPASLARECEETSSSSSAGKEKTVEVRSGSNVFDSSMRDEVSEDCVALTMDIDSENQRAANGAAESRYRKLLRFKHYHEEDMKELSELVIPSPNGVHWIVDEATHRAGHSKKTATEVPAAFSGGKSNSSNAGFLSKSFEKLRSVRRPSAKPEVFADEKAAAATSFRHSEPSPSNADGHESMGTSFLLLALPPSSFQPVFLTPSCIEAHHFRHYVSALNALVACGVCENEKTGQN